MFFQRVSNLCTLTNLENSSHVTSQTLSVSVEHSIFNKITNCQAALSEDREAKNTVFSTSAPSIVLPRSWNEGNMLSVCSVLILKLFKKKIKRLKIGRRDCF